MDRSGDQHEQEADRVAEHVMRMPAFDSARPQAHAVSQSLQRKCACGASCSKCRAQPSNGERHPIATSVGAAAGAAPANAPALVHQALRSSGRPLDDGTREFMEERLGRDFSGVRVHTDGLADASAAMIGAEAYTVGNHVAFAAGKYLPTTSHGRLLLAHELTHVVQQSEGRQALGTIQRQPNKKGVDVGGGVPPKELLWSTAVWPRVEGAAEVLMLAANPDHAHIAWKGLSSPMKMGVAVYMAQYYGTDFARKFAAIHDAAKVPDTLFRQVGPEITPDQLKTQGYHFAGRQMTMGVEAWFDTSGNRLHRVMPRQKSEESKPEDKGEASQEKTPHRKETKPPTQVAPPPPPEKEPPTSADPVCQQSKRLSGSICDNSARICQIAGELGPDDSWAQERCENAKKSCSDSKKRTAECDPVPNS